MTPTLLIVEDDAMLAENIRDYLARARWEVSIAASVADALRVATATHPDLIVADYRLPDETGIALIKAALALDPHVKIVLMTGEGSIQVAVEAVKAGAYDYLSKPVVLAELKLLLERAWEAVCAEKALAFYHRRQARGSGVEALLGKSAPIQRLRETIAHILEMEARIIDGDLPAVLITGETGTGKELVARALHFDGGRRAQPFVEVNCASIPANLLEAELFGHERGAFTDAKERKAGLVESAEGGTLFLDEIGEVDFAIQAKLLKLLEERTVRRLGSVRERKVNVRIISATNRDLERMVHEGRFRADLFFRLRIITLNTPPLRERGADVLLLARNFLVAHGRRYGKKDLELSHDAESLLLQHSWPGNVRELRNVLEQAVLLTRARVIAAADIALRPVPRVAEDRAAGALKQFPTWFSGQGVKLSDVERELVQKTLEQTDWNVSKAARLLGLTRDMLRTRVEKYGLARIAKAPK